MTPGSTQTRQFLLLGLGLWLVAAATGLAPVADGDIFWHLASGREIWRSGHLLTHDPFSIGAAGRPWPDVHWLFQLGAYAVHAWLGLLGVVLVKCALVGAAACLFTWSNPKSVRGVTALAMVGALLCARHLLLARPVIVTLVMLALFCGQLERCRRRDGKLWLLPIAQMVWVNCQGLAALGPALVLAYTVGAVRQVFGPSMPGLFAPERVGADQLEQRRYLRALLGCLGACTLACLATPFGSSALGLPLRLLARLRPGESNPYLQVVENVPTFVAERTGAGDFWHAKWFIALLALSIAVRRARVALSEWLVLGGFTTLALTSNRNLLLLYVVATPIAVRLLMPALRYCRYRLRRTQIQRWTGSLAGAALLTLSCVVAVAAAREPRLDQPTPFRFPAESASAIAAHGGQGRIFSADHQGGFLIWALYPEFRPFFDTRWVLRSKRELSDYLAMVDEPTRFDDFASTHGFSYAVLPTVYPSRYLPLVAHLYRSATWRLVFTNGSEVLFAHRASVRAQGWDLGSDSTTDHILANITSKFTRPELQRAARMHLALLHIAVGEHHQATRALRGLSEPPALALLAQAHLLAGDLTEAQHLAEQLLRGRPDDVHSLTLLANVSMRRDQLPAALQHLRRAARIDPFDDELTRLLRTLEESSHAP